MTARDELEHLLEAHWAVRAPLDIEPLATGVNNESHLIHADSRWYVLKRYRNTKAWTRIAFEHALLHALALANLPFSVPAPIPAADGALFVRTATGGVVSLAHRIDGEPAGRGDATVSFRAGRALATLDIAMSQIRLAPRVRVPAATGTLASAHPSVPDPSRALQRAIPDSDMAAAIGAVLSRAERQWTTGAGGWPVHLIHADYFPSNVLVHAGEISGILDFEFAGSGHRAMDFAIGLIAFGAAWPEIAPSWELIHSFATGYLDVSPLNEHELATVPALILMREATSLVGWLGRKLDGLLSTDEIHARGRRLLALDDWLAANGAALVDRLHLIARR